VAQAKEKNLITGVDAMHEASLALSALLSRRLASMLASGAIRDWRNETTKPEEREQFHADLVDEKRIAFDLLDGHWD
jgi:hypothetical protein